MTENAQRSILIVDDEEPSRELCAIEFKRAGYAVFQAEDGESGLAEARAHHPDVILLDLVMPGIHGFEVLKTLRATPDLARTIVIVRSGKSYKPDIDKAMELGADAYVVKPGDLEDLMRLVDEHIRKARPKPS